MLLVFIPAILGFSQLAYADTIESNGSGGGEWSTGVTSTWNGGVEPIASDDVIIKSGDTVTLTESKTVTGSITIESGGTLIIDGPNGGQIELSGGTINNSGTLTLNGGSDPGSGQINVDPGTINNSGTITTNGGSESFSGQINLTAGSTLNNSGTITTNGGSGNFSGQINLNNGAINNSGTITVNDGGPISSGQINIASNGTLTNECSGTIKVNNGGKINIGGTFINRGTFINNGILTGDDPIDESRECVGGEFLPIDSTALILAGAQTNAVWIMSALAVIGSVAFGALYITSKKD